MFTDNSIMLTLMIIVKGATSEPPLVAREGNHSALKVIYELSRADDAPLVIRAPRPTNTAEGAARDFDSPPTELMMT